MVESILTKKQVKTFEKEYKEKGENHKIICEVRYDDECGNGHNTFAITADGYRKTKNGKWVDEFGGCCHDEIKKRFPKLAHLIKWHLCNSDGPMYYIQNTLYLAGDRDCWGRAKGEPTGWAQAVKFENFPITFKLKEKFLTALSNSDLKNLNIIIIEHKKEPNGYKYGAKFTFNCYPCEWHECPFDTLDEAKEFLNAFQNIKFEIVKTPTGYSEGKERDFDGARACAIWPEASNEVLSLPPEKLKERLLERLPALLAEFKKDIESLGFIY